MRICGDMNGRGYQRLADGSSLDVVGEDIVSAEYEI